mmetsp:Transcript_780/g.1390  ORF Transcript_780/g.1390 Transcript_780/m.1390 type:complete len:219 (-) Transcript_780:280-936(-)
MAIDGANLENSEHLLGQSGILLLQFSALLLAHIVKEDNPDLLPPVELENAAQVKLLDVRVLKNVMVLRLSLSSHSSTHSSAPEIELKSLAPASTTSPEEAIEHVVEVGASRISAALLLPHALLSILIVDIPLLRIAKGLVGLGNFLELLLGLIRVILVLVGVELDGQLLIGLLDLLLRGALLQAQDIVVVLLLHHFFAELDLVGRVLGLLRLGRGHRL